MFDSYNKNSDLYVIVPNKPQYKGEKYQIAVDRYPQPGEHRGPVSALMNEKDEEVELDDFVSLYPEITQIQKIDQYVRYDIVYMSKKKDGYMHLLYTSLTVIREKDEKIIDIGIIDEAAKKIVVVQGTLEGLVDGLLLQLQNSDAPWMAKILYSYRPEQVLAVFNNSADMLMEEPAILADAVENHYNSVYGILVWYVDRNYSIDAYCGTMKAQIMKHIFGAYPAGRVVNKLYLAIASWLSTSAHSFDNDDKKFTIELTREIRRGLDTFPLTEDEKVKIEKDLHNKTLRFFHQQEDKLLEKTYDRCGAHRWRKTHQIIKFLYTALSPIKPLPPRLVRYSLMSIEWLKLHK